MPPQPPSSDGPDQGTEEIPRFGAPDPSEMARFGERPRYVEEQDSEPAPRDETPDEAAEGPYPYGFSETRPKGRSLRRGSSAVPRPVAGAATGIPVWNSGAASAAPPSIPAAAPRPARKRRWELLAAALVLILVAVAVVQVVSRTAFGPQEEVEELLSAVRDGEASDAAEIMDPNVPAEQRLLLQDQIYVVSGRPVEDFEIDRVQRDGDDAEVTARVTQDGVTTPVTFSLERRGRQAGVFPRWRFDGDAQGLYQQVSLRVPEGVQSISVNGRQVQLPAHDSGELDLAALPGDYSFGAGGAEQTVSVLVRDAAAGAQTVEVPAAG
ncbi:hypothetical protein [Kocuria palustris]|uniref:hypothetical protein n=1 Tax=Kocuria palustris TaxID=71999 RepID=UPI0035DA5EA4